MKNRGSSVKIELLHNNLTGGGHILHEQGYNTGRGVSHSLMKYVEKYGVSHACRNRKNQLLDGQVGWRNRIPGLAVTADPRPPQLAHRCRAETNLGYAAAIQTWA